MEKKHLRVLSYNIHKGFSTSNRRFVLRKMREAIREVNADLVMLQEVQGSHDEHKKNIKEWPSEPQFEFLADELWPHSAYGKNAVYTSGHHGNAILSKYPMTFWENIDVSNNRFEKRGLLHGMIEIPQKKKPLHAICTHLGLFEVDRREQVRKLCARIESHVAHGDPLVIGGDFNDWMVRATSTLGKTLEVREAFLSLNGKHARTFPSWMPALQLDRIYYRGMRIEKARTLTGPPWSQLSDHAALYVELGI